MEFKYKLKTRKDMEKAVKNSKRKGGEPLIDDIRGTVKNNSIAQGRYT